jgi:hypothetical protein
MPHITFFSIFNWLPYWSVGLKYLFRHSLSGWLLNYLMQLFFCLFRWTLALIQNPSPKHKIKTLTDSITPNSIGMVQWDVCKDTMQLVRRVFANSRLPIKRVDDTLRLWVIDHRQTCFRCLAILQSAFDARVGYLISHLVTSRRVPHGLGRENTTV